MKCRFCSAQLNNKMVDLGNTPLSNAILKASDLLGPEMWFPLSVYTCSTCYLAQLSVDIESSNLFNDEYSYFSGFSETWLKHCKNYVEKMQNFLSLDSNSQVIEIASNDGTLLKFFKDRNVNCLGIEPTASTAEAATEKGLSVIQKFFDEELAESLSKDGLKADLLVANNVLAHVSNIKQFIAGFPLILKDDGVVTIEFPHLVNLIKQRQFDTIYHEHFFYLSLLAVNKILDSVGLEIFDVEQIPTHGGSLRIYAQKRSTGKRKIKTSVADLLALEKEIGLNKDAFYTQFQDECEQIKFPLLNFLIKAKIENKTVMGYGAAAKGNTLINYCGIKSDLIKMVADKNPTKQGKYLPGSHIPISDEDSIKQLKPDYVLILPWNLESEIIEQLEYIRGWGAKFVIAIPELKIS